MRPSLSRLLVAVLVVATLAYYFWTAMISPGGLPRIHGHESDHFNLLSRGFQQGHLYLDGEVPAGLLKSKNPYDPAQRQGVTVLHDASYFRGKYYIYFGPAPVVTLLLPFSLIVGRDLPLPYAVWFFSSCGYLALVGIFLFAQRRYFPRASGWTLAAGLIAVGGASLVVALLRRANIWELSAASGFGFFAASLYGLVRALHSPHRSRAWATAGGFALGLAVASRPTYLLCSVLFALPLLFQMRPGAAKISYDWRALLGAAASCSLLVAGLLAYNHARFGEWWEFGMRYQLTSVIESESRHFSLTYVPFNLLVYFFSVLHWLPYFPFVSGIDLPPLPPGHGGHEYTFGLFPNLPFSLFSLVLLIGLAGWRTSKAVPLPFRLSVAAVFGAAAIGATLLLCFFGCCIRYMVDFTPWVMLLAAWGVLLGEDRLGGATARRLLRGGALGLSVFSAFTAAAAVVEFYNASPKEPARAYRPVARVLNRPISWIQQLRWPDFGPREIDLSLPADRTPRTEAIVAVGRAQQPTAVVLVDYLDAHRIRLGYREDNRSEPAVFSPVVAAPPGARHTLRLSIGGPYRDFDGARGRLRAQLDGVALWDVPVVSFNVYPGIMDVGPSAANRLLPARFTGEIHAVRSMAMPDLEPIPLAGIRVRITLQPGMVGRAYPLLTSGRMKAGDLLVIRVHSGNKVSFGYDHWGDSLITSPEITAPVGETRVVEFWAPTLSRPGIDPVLLVKVDGTVVWRQSAPAFPSTPQTQYLGRNPIGGSTCEAVLDNAVFEELHLPIPAP